MTSQSLTEHPAALNAHCWYGAAGNKTPVTGPEWPVKVTRGFPDSGVWSGTKPSKFHNLTDRSSEPEITRSPCTWIDLTLPTCPWSSLDSNNDPSRSTHTTPIVISSEQERIWPITFDTTEEEVTRWKRMLWIAPPWCARIVRNFKHLKSELAS